MGLIEIIMDAFGDETWDRGIWYYVMNWGINTNGFNPFDFTGWDPSESPVIVCKEKTLEKHDKDE